jgi:hypothetical protein
MRKRRLRPQFDGERYKEEHRNTTSSDSRHHSHPSLNQPWTLGRVAEVNRAQRSLGRAIWPPRWQLLLVGDRRRRRGVPARCDLLKAPQSEYGGDPSGDASRHVLRRATCSLSCERIVERKSMATCLPVAKRLGSPRNTSVAKAVTGPTRGCVSSRRAWGLCRTCVSSSWSSSWIRFCSCAYKRTSSLRL